MKTALKNTLIFTSVMALSAVAGFTVQNQLAKDQTENISSVGIQTIEHPLPLRPEFAMQTIDGNIRNIKEWDGQIILLNFWATWCPPCMKEIPDFIELQKKYGDQGLQIIGIAIDDEELVKDFAREIQMNYPVMASEMEGVELSQRYGNEIGALPYTAIINRKGEITRKITGELSMIEAVKILEDLDLEV